MRYVRARYNQYQKDLAYRIYVSDSLYYRDEGKRLAKRYIDIITPHEVDNRTGDEIAVDIIDRLNLKVE